MNHLSKQPNVAHIIEALIELPNNTMGVFTPSIQRILDLEKDEGGRYGGQLARHILTWVVHGRPGLTTDQIRDSFAISQCQGRDYVLHRPSDVEMISSCAGLVTGDSDKNTLHLVHESVRGFLFEKEVVPKDPPWQMIASCLMCLSIAKSNTTEEDDSPFYQYAARYWGPHLALVQEKHAGKVEEVVLEFMKDTASLERSFLALPRVAGDAFDGTSALHATVHFNLPYWANRLLCEPKISVDTETSDGQTALHWAVRYGNLRLVELFLRNSANPNKLDHLKETPLHKTLIKPIVNDVDIVRALVRYGAKPELKGPRGYSAMTSAIRYGPTSIAKVLVESQQSLNAEIFEGWTSLRQVFYHGREIIGKSKIGPSKTNGSSSLRQAVENHAQYLTDLLLDRGVSLNHPSSDGWTPLNHAIRYMHNDPSKIERLLTRNPEPSDPNLSAGGETPLQLAISNNRPAIVKLLIEHGANQDEPYENGSTPLIDAINREHKDIVWVLIESGASIDKRAADGHTALTRAVMKDDKSTIWLLVSKGASVFCPVEDLPNLFCWSLAYNDLSLAWFLCQRERIADVPDHHGMTPLHWAAKDGHLEAVRFLVQQDVFLDAKDYRGNTPLILATLSRQMLIMNTLLEHGASADVQDAQGVSALHHASRLGFFDGVRILLRRDGNRNLVDFRGFNALHHAIVGEDGDRGLIRVLATAGVNMEAKEEHGRTPLMLCAQLDRLNRADQLLTQGAKLGVRCPRGWDALEYANHYGSGSVQALLESRWPR
ncbi:hypothetical protein CSAL01_01458 [Colletotrichum salicis]|uniref:Uncharacterized protein n=1 Tax=Colletotrichum salicis TaxID=1209931 RepID=A0A135V8S9_9PEZI|nr:hypothetical protein CSAL01_01458 [Colletotrichum salicis]